MSDDPYRRLLTIAGRQHFVFSARQARDVEMSSSTIQRYAAHGRFVRLHRGVYLIGGTEIRWQQLATGAWLACGPRSVLSFGTASAIWAFCEDVEVADVTVPATHRRSHPNVLVHKSRRLDAVGHRGFRVTSPMRTLLDLAAVEREDRLARFLDLAHRRRLVDLERFRAYLAEPFAAARPGSGVLRAMVDARDPTAPIESDPETLLFEALRMGGVPLPQPQFWVTTRRRRCRIDFAYPQARVAIEIDSWTDHGTRSAFEADRARQNELVELGWTVVRFTWLQLTTAPVDVIVTVGAALGLVPTRWTTPRGRNRTVRRPSRPLAG